MARRLGVAPQYQYFNQPPTNDWFQTVTERFNIYKSTADPTTDEIAENQWIVHLNTTTSSLKVWANVGGVLYSTSLL